MPVVLELKAGISIAEARRLMVHAFGRAGIDEADADARLLLGHALRLDRTELFSRSDRLLQAHEVLTIETLAARRLKREPVSRIFGVREFWSLSFQVNDAVLVPRPETETIVEAALYVVARSGARMARPRILDIGTGSGAIILALLNELPNATGTATDISEAALEVARANAQRLGLSARCSFFACDIASGVAGPFDLIVSNPPYIAHDDIAGLAPEVREHDPALALDGGADGLDLYRAIAGEARRLLAPGGCLIVELGLDQDAPVGALFTKAGLTVSPARADLAGIPRALMATWMP